MCGVAMPSMSDRFKHSYIRLQQQSDGAKTKPKKTNARRDALGDGVAIRRLPPGREARAGPTALREGPRLLAVTGRPPGRTRVSTPGARSDDSCHRRLATRWSPPIDPPFCTPEAVQAAAAGPADRRAGTLAVRLPCTRNPSHSNRACGPRWSEALRAFYVWTATRAFYR